MTPSPMKTMPLPPWTSTSRCQGWCNVTATATGSFKLKLPVRSRLGSAEQQLFFLFLWLLIASHDSFSATSRSTSTSTSTLTLRSSWLGLASASKHHSSRKLCVDRSLRYSTLVHPIPGLLAHQLCLRATSSAVSTVPDSSPAPFEPSANVVLPLTAVVADTSTGGGTSAAVTQSIRNPARTSGWNHQTTNITAENAPAGRRSYSTGKPEFPDAHYRTINDAIAERNIQKIFSIIQLYRNKTVEQQSSLLLMLTYSMNRFRQHNCLPFIQEILLEMDRCGIPWDLPMATAAMNTMINGDMINEAMELFETITGRLANIQLDLTALVVAVRASGHCRPWNHTLGLLDQAYELLSDRPEEVQEVVHTAMINERYRSIGVALDAVNRLWYLYQWMQSHNVPVTIKTMNIMLAAASVHGTWESVSEVLHTMKLLGFSPTIFTFNILLDHSAKLRNVTQALSVVQDMRDNKVTPDASTFNTLLKLCIRTNDIPGFDDVLRSMKGAGVKGCSRTKSLMIRYYGLKNETHNAMDIVDSEPDNTLTAHMLSNAINVCRNRHLAVELLNRGLRLNICDESVFMEAAYVTLCDQDYRGAIQIINMMLQRQISLNCYLVVTAIDACFLWQEKEAGTGGGEHRDVTGLNILYKFLTLVQTKYPLLMTDAVCQKVMKRLAELRMPFAACKMFLGPLAANQFKSEVLAMILRDMQAESEKLWQRLRFQPTERDSQLAKEFASQGLAVVNLFATDQRIKLLKTQHLNHVLRMLFIAKMYPQCIELFNLMAGGNYAMKPSTTTRLTAAPVAASGVHIRGWYPSTFTIAEFVRVARESNQVALACQAILWGASHGVYLPIGVISDAISYAYSEGRTDYATSMYQAAYESGMVNHWLDRSKLIVDLHNYSRGMAYAAMKAAVQEAVTNATTTANSASSTHEVLLTAITGKSLNRPFANTQAVTGRFNDARSYQLMETVQEALIEDFFPPISSSTVPGNSGRVSIKLVIDTAAAARKPFAREAANRHDTVDLRLT